MTLKRILVDVAVCAGLLVLLGGTQPALAEDGPGKLEMSGALHRLEKFETQVKRANGQPLNLSHDAKEALARIKALKQKYPGHPKVEELFQRARKALKLSKGKTMEITPDMLLYRKNEERLQAMFAEHAAKNWDAWLAEKKASGKVIEKAFPPPDPETVAVEDLVGSYVVLDAFEYPTNEFTDLGNQYVFVGSGARGFWFVDLSNRSWRGVYEAVRRYKRLICRDVPEGGRWTVVARITRLMLLVPQAGEEKTESAFWGWGVVPEAIYVPDRTFAWTDAESELGGHFAGEVDMEQIKSAMYTVTSIPDDVTPKRLAEIYAIAIKEKNYPLYLDCIDPDRRVTRKALHRIAYHWDLHQQRFAEFYCHVVVGEPKITVIKGFTMEHENLEEFFLTDEEKKEIEKHAEPLVEHAELKTKAFDERGRQYGSEKPRFFKRVESGRWYITNYPQPF